MRSAAICQRLLSISGLFASLAWAGNPPPTIVYPTGTFPQDVSNVQAAVSSGGTVVLEATDESGTPMAFNFGPAEIGAGEVTLFTDAIVEGTRTPAGDMTTITGGIVPIAILGPIQFAIEGIRFIGPLDGAIGVEKSRDGLIAHNVILDVVPYESGGSTTGIGIGVNSGNGPTSNITGNIRIIDNVIDGVPADAGYGIVSAHHDATATIQGNKVSRTNLNGILAGFISKNAFILENSVAPGPAEAPITAGNGIFVGHGRGGHFVIAHNTVICTNPLADGIVVIASAAAPVDGSTIFDNDVTMVGSQYGGISLYDSPAHIHVSHNTVRGDGAYALQVSFFTQGTPPAVENTFEENIVDTFDAGTSDIFLDVNASLTTLCDQPGSLVDHGSGTVAQSQCISPKTRR